MREREVRGSGRRKGMIVNGKGGEKDLKGVVRGEIIEYII